MNFVYTEIKDPAAPNTSAVSCTLRISGEKIRIPTSVSLHPKYWDRTRRCVRRSHPKSSQMNAQIMSVKDRLEQSYEAVLADPCTELSRKTVLQTYRSLSDTSLRKLLEDHKLRLERRSRYVAKIPMLIDHIETVEASVDQPLSIESLPVYGYDLLRERFQAKELADSTQWSYLSILCAALRADPYKGPPHDAALQIIRRSDFDRTPTWKASLSWDETLAFIANASTGTLAATDYATIQVATGMRYSDVHRIALGEVDVYDTEDGWGGVCYSAKKTGARAFASHPELDIRPSVARIKQAAPLSCTRYNRLIKKVARSAGLDRDVHSTNGSTVRPLYSVLSSHDFKRTFVRDMGNRGCQSAEIALMTGNATRTLEHYETRSQHRTEQIISRLRNLPSSTSPDTALRVVYHRSA